MKAYSLAPVLVILAVAVGFGCANQKAASTTKTERYGADLTIAEPLAVAALAGDPAGFVGKTVRIEGTVSAVCQGKGCWAEVAGDGGVTFLAKSLDDGVLIPTDCVGRRIAVQGTVTALGGSEDAEHEHSEHAEENADGHVCPRPEYVVAMEGVELR